MEQLDQVKDIGSNAAFSLRRCFREQFFFRDEDDGGGKWDRSNTRLEPADTVHQRLTFVEGKGERKLFQQKYGSRFFSDPEPLFLDFSAVRERERERSSIIS